MHDALDILLYLAQAKYWVFAHGVMASDIFAVLAGSERQRII